MLNDQFISDMSKKNDKYYKYTRPEIIDLIPKTAKKILDVGCGAGFFGEQLKYKLNAEVWGIELNNEAATLAKEKINKVLIGDVFDLINKLPDFYFDCIVFNDILEHLTDPYSILLKTKNKLNKNGVIVCSIPNIRYFFTLKDLLLKKQWKYEDAGILDKTHLRFFTKNSITDMFNDLNFTIIKMHGINEIKTWKFNLINVLLFGYLSDTRYLQFACVVKPKEL
jgi:2-polyprenyl-3-methyl-5-hydroxy-6-metoxy-1,4-benzoquinol methylase